MEKKELRQAVERLVEIDLWGDDFATNRDFADGDGSCSSDGCISIGDITIYFDYWLRAHHVYEPRVGYYPDGSGYPGDDYWEVDEVSVTITSVEPDDADDTVPQEVYDEIASLVEKYRKNKDISLYVANTVLA